MAMEVVFLSTTWTLAPEYPLESFSKLSIDMIPYKPRSAPKLDDLTIVVADIQQIQKRLDLFFTEHLDQGWA